jgi:hypothetical protein
VRFSLAQALGRIGLGSEHPTAALRETTLVVDCRHAIEQKEAEKQEKQAGGIKERGSEVREQGCADQAQR